MYYRENCQLVIMIFEKIDFVKYLRSSFTRSQGMSLLCFSKLARMEQMGAVGSSKMCYDVIEMLCSLLLISLYLIHSKMHMWDSNTILDY